MFYLGEIQLMSPSYWANTSVDLIYCKKSVYKVFRMKYWQICLEKLWFLFFLNVIILWTEQKSSTEDWISAFSGFKFSSAFQLLAGVTVTKFGLETVNISWKNFLIENKINIRISAKGEILPQKSAILMRDAGSCRYFSMKFWFPLLSGYELPGTSVFSRPPICLYRTKILVIYLTHPRIFALECQKDSHFCLVSKMCYSVSDARIAFF